MNRTIECGFLDGISCTVGIAAKRMPCIRIITGAANCPTKEYRAGRISFEERNRRVVDIAIARHLNDPRAA